MVAHHVEGETGSVGASPQIDAVVAEGDPEVVDVRRVPGGVVLADVRRRPQSLGAGQPVVGRSRLEGAIEGGLGNADASLIEHDDVPAGRAEPGEERVEGIAEVLQGAPSRSARQIDDRVRRRRAGGILEDGHGQTQGASGGLVAILRHDEGAAADRRRRPTRWQRKGARARFEHRGGVGAARRGPGQATVRAAPRRLPTLRRCHESFSLFGVIATPIRCVVVMLQIVGRQCKPFFRGLTFEAEATPLGTWSRGPSPAN